MLEIVVKIPDVLYDDYAEDVHFRDMIAAIVAAEMSCRDDAGAAVHLDSLTEIDIFLEYYDVETSRSSGPTVFVRIEDLDYSDRMENIYTRITRVARRISGNLPEGREKVSVTFIPVKQDCRVAY